MIAQGSLSAQETFKGLYVSSFERNDFMPCNSAEHWWQSGKAYSKIEEFIKSNSLRSDKGDFHPNVPLYIEVVGTVSEKGQWGHMGRYEREIKSIELIDISASNKCNDKHRLNK